MPPLSPFDEFIRSFARIQASGAGTAEQSYYPCVSALLTEACRGLQPRRDVVPHPAGQGGQLPDLGILDRASRAIVLPVEVKPVTYSMATLLASDQARGYAEEFGGGRVLLTNLREWVIAERGADGALVPLQTIQLGATGQDLARLPAPQRAHHWTALRVMLAQGTTTRATLKKPSQVASLLAYHAREIRDLLAPGGRATPALQGMKAIFDDGLHIDVDPKLLPATVAQTLVYGVFSAWLESEDPDGFSWMQAAYNSPVPVFAEILHEALSPALLRSCNLIPELDAIARVMQMTDRDGFTRAFDGDAIQYFYEPFLAEFDPALRNALGVWYTPQEIARYQIARIHHHLKNDLGFAEGLADDAVFLLDPATGTGTYLVEACRFLFDVHVENGEPSSVAAGRALEAMATRFIGFEILPSAFIIAQLHLHRFLVQLGAEPGHSRLRIYLTDALTGWREEDSTPGATLFPELEDELRHAAEAKHRDPVIAVVGNPPYQGYSTAVTVEERQMMQPWKDATYGAWGLRKARLDDLYLRFWRVAMHRIVTMTEQGIVSFITNRKWLGGRSYPAVRQAVVEDFDAVWVDDLHGGVHDRSHAVDQSIFTTNIASGIQVGTAIVTAVRSPETSSQATVRVASLRGSADGKRKALSARGKDEVAMTAAYEVVEVSERSRYRFVADIGDDFPPLDEYLPTFFSGVQPVRDEAVIDHDRSRLMARMKDYFDPELSWDALVERHPGFGVTRARYDGPRTRRRLLSSSSFHESRVVSFLYRPFDIRWLYWEPDHKLLNEARREALPYWDGLGTQVAITAPQTPRRVGASRLLGSFAVGAFASMDPDARMFPLYPPRSLTRVGAGELELPITSHAAEPTTVSPAWVSTAGNVLGTGDRKLAGETIFYALIAVTNAPAWLEVQPVEQDDFVTVPLPAAAEQLRTAGVIGKALTALYDTTKPVPGVTTGNIREHLRDLAVPDPCAVDPVLTVGRKGEHAGRRDGQTVAWGTSDEGWRGIPDAVWEFSVGGFQVLPKWLSYRKDQVLTSADRETFRILCRRIQAVLDLHDACDALYLSATENPLVDTRTD